MQAIHRTLLEINEEFLVNETPTAPFLEALVGKDVLSDLDVQQLDSLEPQGPRAVKRFVLHVLPLRGPLAYPSLLEALQEAQAQHLVDLLLEGEAVLSAAVKPIELPDLPEPPRRLEDPNEYARKLIANKDLIEDVVSPEQVIAPLLQNGVMTSLEEGLLDSVQGQHVLTWTILWGVLLQRGLRAYHAFMGALLQNGYSALFHTIEETKVTGVEAMKSALTRNMIAADTAKFQADGLHHRNTHDPSGLPLPTRGAIEAAPPSPPPPHFRDSPQQLGAESARSRAELLPSVSPRPHASPLLPGYSKSDLDFLYTPRTDLQVKDPAEGHWSDSDALYNPTWADPYNHLRGADVVSPGYVYRKTSASVAVENGSLRSSTEMILPPRSASLDLSDLNHRGDKPNEHEHRPPISTYTDDPRDHAEQLFARLDAISERESEFTGTTAGRRVGERETGNVSKTDTLPHVPDTMKENADLKRGSSAPDKWDNRHIPKAPRPSSIGVPKLNLDPDSPSIPSSTYRITK